jgi:hypothetical protein
MSIKKVLILASAVIIIHSNLSAMEEPRYHKILSSPSSNQKKHWNDVEFLIKDWMPREKHTLTALVSRLMATSGSNVNLSSTLELTAHQAEAQHALLLQKTGGEIHTTLTYKKKASAPQPSDAKSLYDESEGGLPSGHASNIAYGFEPTFIF